MRRRVFRIPVALAAALAVIAALALLRTGSEAPPPRAEGPAVAPPPPAATVSAGRDALAAGGGPAEAPGEDEAAAEAAPATGATPRPVPADAASVPVSVPAPDAPASVATGEGKLEGAVDPRSAAALARALKLASTGRVTGRPEVANRKPGPASVIGTITDDQGKPIAGALVLALGWRDRPAGGSVTTNDAGAYALAHDGISDGGPKRVRADHPRYRPREVGIPARKPDEPPTVCDIWLEDGPLLLGTAVLDGGRPAEGASVTALGRAAPVTVDRRGEFVLPVLAPGTHLVLARLVPRMAALGRTTIGPDGFPLGDGRLALVLREEGTIEASGLVMTSPGLPPPVVHLWANAPTPLGPPPFMTQSPGPDGIVRFEAVPPGVYTVATATPSIGYHSPDPIQAWLGPGERREVWLGRRGTAVLNVRAMGDAGPPARAVFSAWADGGGNAITLTTAGQARFESLDAGRYFVFCNDQVGGLGRDVVTVAPGEVRTLELRLLKAGRLRGMLADEDGTPAVGARVTSETQEGRIEREAVVDAQGGFALEMLYPGRHVIRARLDGRTMAQSIEVAVGEDKGPVGFVLGGN